MNDLLQEILQPGGLESTLFPPTSRYHGIGVSKLTTGEGEPIAYLRRRFVPPQDRFAILQEHTVTEGERLDIIAARYLGDPEQFWRICDANGAIDPNELTETIGGRIRITLPEGIPGF